MFESATNMIVLCLLSVLAMSSAAPQLRLNFHYAPHDDDFFQRAPAADSDEFFGGEIFDTKRFFEELETEMNRFNQMLDNFYKHFPTESSEPRIQGNEYIITQTLTGFDEEDIKVKAKEGLVMIQAVHKSDEGNQRTYLDLKTLPSFVNVNGSWTYEMGVLRVVFPLKESPATITTTAPATDDRSREEMDNTNKHDHKDADVGLETLDKEAVNKDAEILTNNIPRERQPVEATTYAVDLKNEVEFVPIKY